MKTTFKLEGLKDCEKALGELADTFGAPAGKRTLVRVMTRRLQPVADHAKALASVDKGDLRQSIKVGQRLNRSQRRVTVKESDIEVYAGPSGLPQGITEEFGTDVVSPQPFMRPAWDAEKAGAASGLAGDLAAEIDKTAQRLGRKAQRLLNKKG